MIFKDIRNRSFHSAFHFPIWRQVHLLPRPFVSWWQFMEFKRVLRSAYDSVPFYRELLCRKGVSPDQIRSILDIPKLPVLSKEIFRKYPVRETLHKDVFRKREYVWNQTSGTTGMPFRYALNSFYVYYQDPHYLRYSEYCKYRFLTWKGIPLSFIAKNMKVGELGVKYPRPNLLYCSPEEINKNPEKVLQQLQEFKPHLIEGVPTFIIEITRAYERNKGKFNVQVPFINTHGERLTEGNRNFLKELFGAEVYSRYGTGETGVIGVECDRRNGFHILEESFIVEIVDDNYSPLPDGKRGRVLVSFFYNDAMPFLRYDTGDWGMIIPEPCRCGIPARRIQIDGRAGETTKLKGRNIGIVQFEMILSYFSKSILRFQLAKTGIDVLELRIIPTPNFSPDVINKLRQEFQTTIGLSPSVLVVNSIPYSNRGKTKVFIDET